MLNASNCTKWVIGGAVIVTSAAFVYNYLKRRKGEQRHEENSSKELLPKVFVPNSNQNKESQKITDDMEDISLEAIPNQPRESKLFIKQRKRPPNSISRLNHEKPSDFVPGVQQIYVKSYGCSHNSSDTEYMMGLLSQYGYAFSDSMDSSDLILINSCTVKNPSQDTVGALIQKAKGIKKPVVVSGCIPQADRNLPFFDGVSLLGITQIDRIVEIVEQTLIGNTMRLLSKKSLPSLDLPKIRKNSLIEIIPLSTGCLGACTYCKTKHARGKLGSYLPDAILKQVLRAIDEGVQQIWLTSEDTGAYGLDIDSNIAELLEMIIGVLPSNVMLRLGMTNPPYMMNHLKSICKVLQHPCVFEFIHIPVQSGSNETLKHMVREYTREEFEYTVEELKKEVPNLTIATDIICGFPTESPQDHQNTLNLIKKYKFPILNISQFYPRPGTPAATLKRIPTKIVKERSRELTQLFESYHTFDHLINSIQQVWFSDISDRSNHIVGHTKQYIKVLVERDLTLLGTSSPVRILKASKWHLMGEIL